MMNASGGLSSFQIDYDGKMGFTPIEESYRLDKCSIPSTPDVAADNCS